MNLLQSLLGESRSITTVDDYLLAVNDAVYQGGYEFTGSGIVQTLAGQSAEAYDSNFRGFAGAFGNNSVIFSCMLARASVFSAARFQFQRINNGRPSELFGGASLSLLEQPWSGGTTQDLLLRMIQDADLAGNSYWTVNNGEMVRLRPDWVSVILAKRLVNGRTMGYQKMGYVYNEGGVHNGDADELVVLYPHEVAHFAPIPDPLASYRGMSWLTPIVREVQNDELMMRHKRKFFENGATPNMVVKLDAAVPPEKFERFKAIMESDHDGVDNAYRTMYMGGGADVTVVGADLKQLDFKAVQGHGETRIAAAAGVPPVIVGLSEGLEAATYSNYGQARRRFADGTVHPLWQNAAGSLQMLVAPPAPGGAGTPARLWYDSRDVPFLREDEKDAAEIQFTQAQAIRQLIDGGYEPASVVSAVTSGDFGLLVHSGLMSVQLQAPGSSDAPIPIPSDAPNA